VEEILAGFGGFFGEIMRELAKVIENSFSGFGQSADFIVSEEISGAFIVGLGYS